MRARLPYAHKTSTRLAWAKRYSCQSVGKAHLRIVRAIATRCFSPPDSFRPRSPTSGPERRASDGTAELKPTGGSSGTLGAYLGTPVSGRACLRVDIYPERLRPICPSGKHVLARRRGLRFGARAAQAEVGWEGNSGLLCVQGEPGRSSSSRARGSGVEHSEASGGSAALHGGGALSYP